MNVIDYMKNITFINTKDKRFILSFYNKIDLDILCYKQYPNFRRDILTFRGLRYIVYLRKEYSNNHNISYLLGYYKTSYPRNYNNIAAIGLSYIELNPDIKNILLKWIDMGKYV